MCSSDMFNEDYVRVENSIRFHLVEAKDIPKVNERAIDIFCLITIGKQHTRTSTIRGSSMPFWDYIYTFGGLSGDFLDITVDLWEEARFTKRLIGQVKILSSEMEKLQEKGDMGFWRNVELSKRRKKILESSGGSIPKIRMAFKYIQERILSIKQYEPLLALLIDPTFNAISCLSMCSTDLLGMCRTLMRILEGRGTSTAVKFVKDVTLAEIRNTPDPHVIFRSNTIATKVVDRYMNLIGVNYLRRVLKPSLRRILQKDAPLCEVDTAKLAKDSTASVEKKLELLLGHCDRIISAIFASTDECPIPFKVIFSHLQAQARKRFPNSHVVEYTVVTAFIFLRFFNPAILAPKKYGILDIVLDDRQKRTLLLISKVIQHLANQTDFGWKEHTLPIESLNSYIANNKSRMQSFIQCISFADVDHRTMMKRNGSGFIQERSRLNFKKRRSRPLSQGVLSNSDNMLNIDLEKELASIYRFMVQCRPKIENELRREPERFDGRPVLTVIDRIGRISRNLEYPHSSSPRQSLIDTIEFRKTLPVDNTDDVHFFSSNIEGEGMPVPCYADRTLHDTTSTSSLPDVWRSKKKKRKKTLSMEVDRMNFIIDRKRRSADIASTCRSKLSIQEKKEFINQQLSVCSSSDDESDCMSPRKDGGGIVVKNLRTSRSVDVIPGPLNESSSTYGSDASSFKDMVFKSEVKEIAPNSTKTFKKILSDGAINDDSIINEDDSIKNIADNIVIDVSCASATGSIGPNIISASSPGSVDDTADALSPDDELVKRSFLSTGGDIQSRTGSAVSDGWDSECGNESFDTSTLRVAREALLEVEAAKLHSRFTEHAGRSFDQYSLPSLESIRPEENADFSPDQDTFSC